MFFFTCMTKKEMFLGQRISNEDKNKYLNKKYLFLVILKYSLHFADFGQIKAALLGIKVIKKLILYRANWSLVLYISLFYRSGPMLSLMYFKVTISCYSCRSAEPNEERSAAQTAFRDRDCHRCLAEHRSQISIAYSVEVRSVSVLRTCIFWNSAFQCFFFPWSSPFLHIRKSQPLPTLKIYAFYKQLDRFFLQDTR